MNDAIRTASESQLRAWADYRVISSATMAEELERRRSGGRVSIDAPPLDYEIDIPLDPREITPDGWPESAVVEDDEPLPFASRPIPVFEVLALSVVTLIGVGLLVWSAS